MHDEREPLGAVAPLLGGPRPRGVRGREREPASLSASVADGAERDLEASLAASRPRPSRRRRCSRRARSGPRAGGRPCARTGGRHGFRCRRDTSVATLRNRASAGIVSTMRSPSIRASPGAVRGARARPSRLGREWPRRAILTFAARRCPEVRSSRYVTGELDLATAPRLDEALAGARRPSVVVVDLSGCTFLDSAGIRTLVGAARPARGRRSWPSHRLASIPASSACSRSRGRHADRRSSLARRRALARESVGAADRLCEGFVEVEDLVEHRDLEDPADLGRRHHQVEPALRCRSAASSPPGSRRAPWSRGRSRRRGRGRRDRRPRRRAPRAERGERVRNAGRRLRRR